MSTIKNILLTVAYDGTDYSGWQRQENGITIQQRLEEALGAKVIGASRTDAGVHALGQRASFITNHMPIPLDKLPQVINAKLPKDISVCSAILVPEDFNPRFRAKSKTYCYQIYNSMHPNPLLSRYSTFVPHSLDVKKMEQAAAHFVGRHDFAAFCAAGSSAKTTVRTILSCRVESEKPVIKVIVTGDGFLYNMVRIIAGTILYAGKNKLSPDDIPEIISSRDRTKAGKTMPPEGLTLVEVMYEEKL